MRNKKIQPWLEAGVSRFTKRGPSGIKISEVAKDIKTSSSSFYHYFNTKEEYIEQLIEYWHEEGTMRIIKQVLLVEDSAKAIELLFTLIFETNFEYECFLLQMRIAARENTLFQKKVKETEKLRISFLNSLLAASGMHQGKTQFTAKQVHNYITGYLVSLNMIPPSRPELKLFLQDLNEIFGI